MSPTLPAPADPSFLALQAAVAGRFFLESELGRGGMGIVYLARDVILERPVAIKLLAPALASRDDMRQRFLREARLAAQCFHPNIVPIHEVAEDGQLAWFVMGYVAGETLADRLRRVGTLPADSIRRIGREVGWALAYAHERGVIHRDVKPENILLEQGTDRALIADFGIAVGNHTAPLGHDIAGTTRFMAPEQALGDVIDGRADLYALGVTLHLAATGTYPTRAEGAFALIAQDASARAPSLRTSAPSLPLSVADAIDRCLAVHANERFASAVAFVEALAATSEDAELPVDARAARSAALSTQSLIDWSIVIGVCGFFLVLGEASGTISRGIMASMVQSALAIAAAVGAVRIGEVLIATRRAVRRGVLPEVVADAIAPPPSPPVRPVGAWIGLGTIAVGLGLAFAQGTVDEMVLPGVVDFLGNLLTYLAPPLLVHRAMTGVRRSTGLSTWLYTHVRKPLARRLVSLMGGKVRDAIRPVPANAPTEFLLDRMAHDIFDRLPPTMQHDLRALPAATAALAEEAVALRARAQALSGEQRAVRRSPANVEQVARLNAIVEEQAAVNARLGATIAALETIRLDLLRLEVNRTIPGNITDHLQVVRDLQHRVDANDDVRRLLRGRAPEHTPV